MDLIPVAEPAFAFVPAIAYGAGVDDIIMRSVGGAPRELGARVGCGVEA